MQFLFGLLLIFSLVVVVLTISFIKSLLADVIFLFIAIINILFLLLVGPVIFLNNFIYVILLLSWSFNALLNLITFLIFLNNPPKDEK